MSPRRSPGSRRTLGALLLVIGSGLALLDVAMHAIQEMACRANGAPCPIMGYSFLLVGAALIVAGALLRLLKPRPAP